MDNKNIFIKQEDKNKDKYYKIMEHRQKALCMQTKRQSEYIRYLEYILEKRNINYYKVK